MCSSVAWKGDRHTAGRPKDTWRVTWFTQTSRGNPIVGLLNNDPLLRRLAHSDLPSWCLRALILSQYIFASGFRKLEVTSPGTGLCFLLSSLLAWRSHLVWEVTGKNGTQHQMVYTGGPAPLRWLGHLLHKVETGVQQGVFGRTVWILLGSLSHLLTSALFTVTTQVLPVLSSGSRWATY